MVSDSDYVVLLGSKIARLRKKQGLNQFEFADKCGKMVNTISKIERGIGDPRLSTLLDISRALNISVIELLDNRFISPALNNFSNEKNTDAAIEKLLKQCDEKSKKAILAVLEIITAK